MTIKEFITSRLQLFFFLVTLILIASIVLGCIFDPEKELRYYHLLSPLIIAGLCVLPTCLTYYKKEPTPLQFLIRQLIELSLIGCIVLLVVTPPEEFGDKKLTFYFLPGSSVLIIYLLSMVIIQFKKSMQSKELTKQLKKFQENAGK